MIKLPTPATAISVLSLFVALGSAGVAATGGNFILGVTNTATTRTILSASVPGEGAMAVENNSTAEGSFALRVKTPEGRPPMKINSTTKVEKLNADLIDGLDSADMARGQRFPFSVAPGATSAAIALPANLPVLAVGGLLAGGTTEGTLAIRFLRDVADNHIEYIGTLNPVGPISAGASSTAGTVIGYLDGAQTVAVEIAGPTGIRIRNASGEVARTGILTLVW